MMRIGKGYNVKIISVIVILAFLTTTLLYAYPPSDTSRLRVPLIGSSSAAQNQLRTAKVINMVKSAKSPQAGYASKFNIEERLGLSEAVIEVNSIVVPVSVFFWGFASKYNNFSF